MVVGCFPGKICSGPYFTEAVAALRKNEQACSLLGEPVRVKALKIGDEGNWVTKEAAQVGGAYELLA